jgi:hypothetical protein
MQLRDDIDWPVVPQTADEPAFQASEAVYQELALPHSVLSELGLSFPDKRFRIGATQARILDYIVQGFVLHGAVSQEMLRKSFPKIPGPELYYRLEQLRLLGFIEKEKIGVRGDKPAYTYRVSREYQAARGL